MANLVANPQDPDASTSRILGDSFGLLERIEIPRQPLVPDRAEQVRRSLKVVDTAHSKLVDLLIDRQPRLGVLHRTPATLQGKEDRPEP